VAYNYQEMHSHKLQSVYQMATLVVRVIITVLCQFYLMLNQIYVLTRLDGSHFEPIYKNAHGLCIKPGISC
jgi:hypothetical protein